MNLHLSQIRACWPIVTVHDNKIFICGGYDLGNEDTAECYFYELHDPIKLDTNWRKIVDFPCKLRNGFALSLKDIGLVVVGHKNAWRYDSRLNLWICLHWNLCGLTFDSGIAMGDVVIGASLSGLYAMRPTVKPMSWRWIGSRDYHECCPLVVLTNYYL